MKRSVPIFAAALLTAALVPAVAQETGSVDEEALFGSPQEAAGSAGEGSSDLIAGPEEEAKDQSLTLLKSQGAEVGGAFRFKATSSWDYEGPLEEGPSRDDLALDLGARIFLDSRPADDFRVIFKTDVSYPFDDQGGERSFDDVFSVKELFADFRLADAAFFRAGKQTANWGVGYYFSPADLLNVTEIDPEDPTAELEGPVALKAQFPFGADNFYLYAIFEDAEAADELGLAPKLELVIGDIELGLGAYFRKGDASSAMTTATTTVGDFRIFGEGVLSRGSNRTFVVEDKSSPLGLRTEGADSDELFPSLTAGLVYSFIDDEENFNLSVSAQYLYNGEGYEDGGLLSRNSVAAAALVSSGDLTPQDLRNAGRHYGAVGVTWSSMFGSDFDSGCLWLGNLSDGSGTVTPQVSWRPSDQIVLTAKTGFRYGESGDEYAPRGDGMTFAIVASLGGGAF